MLVHTLTQTAGILTCNTKIYEVHLNAIKFSEFDVFLIVLIIYLAARRVHRKITCA